MRPKGEDVAAAIIEWSKDEIKDATSDFVDLGKFFFSVSSAALGVVITLVKLTGPFRWTIPFAFGLFLYAISAFIAITMVQPRVWQLTGETDLFHEYRKSLDRGVWFVWTWFTVWVFATIFAAAALL